MRIPRCATRKGKAKLLQLGDVHFFKHNKEVPFEQLRNKNPDSVTVTFYRQKNGVKKAEISMDPTQGPLCPVKAFKSIILRILSYLDENVKSTANMVRHGTKIMGITSKATLQHLRNTVDSIGHDILGFGPDDVGNHSIRSSFTMFLILNREAPDIVQLQGHWKSRAFLNYIHMETIFTLYQKWKKTLNAYA